MLEIHHSGREPLICTPATFLKFTPMYVDIYQLGQNMEGGKGQKECFFVCLFVIHLYCLVGCLSIIVWTHAVLGVLYACVLYLHLFNAIEHVSHGKAL